MITFVSYLTNLWTASWGALVKLILFLPSAIIAAFIVFISIFAGGLLGQLFGRLLGALKISGAEIAGLFLRWVIIIFGIFTALKFLLPDLEILASKFADFLLFAAALAVGVGLSKKVGEWLESIKGRKS